MINIFADPAGVFHSNEKLVEVVKPGEAPKAGGLLRPNFCIKRLQHVLDTDFDSFLFGSSKASAIDVDKFRENHIEGSWYRLNYPGGTFDQHYNHLNILLERGKKVKNVIITIDEFSFSTAPSDIRKNIYEMAYFHGIGGFIKTWSFFLFRKPTKVDLLIFRGVFRRVPVENPGLDEGIVGWEKSTWPDRKHARFWRSSRHEKSLKDAPGIDVGANRLFYADMQLDFIKRTISLCKKKNINLRLIVNPQWYKSYLLVGFDGFNKYLKKVVELHPVTDFSGIHEYSTEHSYWAETLHFTPYLGDMMIKILGGGRPKGIFGKTLRRNNFEASIATKKAAIDDFISKKLTSCEGIHSSFNCTKKP